MALHFNYFFYFSILFTLFIKIRGSEEGCGESEHGISCCSNSFTLGDNQGDGGEMFIQASQYVSSCEQTCKSKYPTESVGITESIFEKYTSGDGINKKKCWCEFGVPKLVRNANYYTCIFPKPDAQKLVRINPAEIEGEIGVGYSFNFDYQSRPSVIGIAVDRKHYTGGEPGCCEKCRHFGRTDLYNYEYDSWLDENFDVNKCRCLTSDRPKFRSKRDGSETRYCGSNSTFLEQVDGTFGVGTDFRYKSAENVGSMAENPFKSRFEIRWIESSEECCEVCSNKFPESQMVKFMRSVRMCFCYKAIPEKRPKIYLKGTYNGVCHNE